MAQDELEAVLEDLTKDPMNEGEPVRTYTIQKTAAGVVEVRPGWIFDNAKEQPPAQDRLGNDPLPPDQAPDSGKREWPLGRTQGRAEQTDCLDTIEYDASNMNTVSPPTETPPRYLPKTINSVPGKCSCGCMQCPGPKDDAIQPEVNPVPLISMPPDPRPDEPAGWHNEQPEEDLLRIPIPPLRDQKPGVMVAEHWMPLPKEKSHPEESLFFAYCATLVGGEGNDQSPSGRQGHALVHLYDSGTIENIDRPLRPPGPRTTTMGTQALGPGNVPVNPNDFVV